MLVDDVERETRMRRGGAERTEGVDPLVDQAGVGRRGRCSLAGPELRKCLQAPSPILTVNYMFKTWF